MRASMTPGRFARGNVVAHPITHSHARRFDDPRAFRPGQLPPILHGRIQTLARRFARPTNSRTTPAISHSQKGRNEHVFPDF